MALIQTFPSGKGGGGATYCYIVGQVPYASDWLSLTPNGAALTPNEKLIYLILTDGKYYHNFVRWDATANIYLPIASGGAGAIFADVDTTKTPLDDDWLMDDNGDTIEPQEGLLYLVITSGEYENSIYRFDETNSVYLLVFMPKQFSTMPTASAYYASSIIQYTGISNANYKHNQFYECVENSGVYSWENTRVEEPETQEINQADFDNLPLAQKNNGKAYFIPDASFETHYVVNAGCVPIGTTIMVFNETAPDNFLKCDGTVYPIERYSQLAQFFEDAYGSSNVFGGDGTTTFAVPDMDNGDANTPLITLLPANVSPIFCIAFVDSYVTARQDYTSREKFVGLWEDGSFKYQISITGTTINATSGMIQTGLTDIIYAELERFQVSNGTYIKNLLDSVAIKTDGTEIAMVADSGSLFKNQTFYATINYKKSEV